MTRIVLRVSSNAKRSEIVGRYGEGWKVRVAAPREDGKANTELLSLLAGVLDVPARQLRIVAGAASRDKILAIEGRSFDEVSDALSRA